MPGLEIDTELKGWKIITGYKLRSQKPDGKLRVIGYITDKQIAQAIANKGGSWGDKGEITEVQILTQDGKTGYVLQPKAVDLSKQDALITDSQQRILAQLDLDPHERIILGLKPEEKK